MSQNNATSDNKEPWWRYLLKYGVPLVITVGLCYMLFSKIDFREMIRIIRQDCNFWWIGLAMAISIFSHIFRGMRWRIQLQALDIQAPLTPVVFSIFGTYAVNLVFPRLGEVWRCGYIASRERAPFTTVFGSMVADRLADTITVALLTIVTFLLASAQMLEYVNQNPESFIGLRDLVSSPWLYAAIIACVIGIWLFFKVKTSNKLILKIRQWVKDLWEGFVVVTRMKGIGRWLLLTLMIWGCYFFQLYVAFFAFPFTSQIVADHGMVAVLVCFVLSSLAMAVPSNGGIGPWQYAIMFGLAFYGLPIYIDGAANPETSAFANLVLGSQTLLLILLGIITFIYIALSKKK